MIPGTVFWTLASFSFCVISIPATAALGFQQSVSATQDSARPLVMKEFLYEVKCNSLTSEGKLDREEREFKADSGSIAVPENRNNPSSRTIHLPVVRVRATGDHPIEPIFWFGGGPGMSNMGTFRYDYFMLNHDQVMVGYRGVDGSVSLGCPEVVHALKEADDFLADETLRKVGNAYGECLTRLKKEGVDVDGYTTLEVVEDVDAVRRALGYENINILSESYGTRLAYLYAVKYPDRVHRMVMIGANPPGGFAWDPRQADELLRHYARLWSQDPEASERCPDLIAAIRNVNQNMPNHWLFFSIHPGNVKVAANAFLFERETAAKIFDAYCAAANGDASGLWLISLASQYIFPEMLNWGENASKAVSADYDSTRNYSSEMVPPDAIMGTPLGRFLWGPAEQRQWSIRLIPEEYRQLHHSDVQTLILSGSLDFSTPAANAARDIIPYFNNSQQITLAEMGHVQDLWRLQPRTTHRILTSFFETGVADTSLCKYEPMNFDVSSGFPTVAKRIVYGGAAVAAVLVGGLIWLIAR
jgi:pimeloyl-ACP methyl ester carboxylesterase